MQCIHDIVLTWEGIGVVLEETFRLSCLCYKLGQSQFNVSLLCGCLLSHELVLTHGLLVCLQHNQVVVYLYTTPILTCENLVNKSFHSRVCQLWPHHVCLMTDDSRIKSLSYLSIFATSFNAFPCNISNSQQAMHLKYFVTVVAQCLSNGLD